MSENTEAGRVSIPLQRELEQYRCDMLSVKQTSSPDDLRIYIKFSKKDGTYESHELSIGDYVGDTPEQFAESLEELARQLRKPKF